MYRISHFLLPILYLHRAYFERGVQSILKGKANMDSLIAIGTGASVLYGMFAIMRMSYGLGHGDMELVRTYSNSLYFQAAGMILTILSFVEFLEEQSGSRTAKAVAGLKKLSPDTTIVKRNGVLMEVPLDALQKGEIFYLRPGMRVPADGMILRGRCAVDESAITGESLPVEKLPGNRVVCATTIMSGTVACQAEKIGEETTLAQIIRLVERDGREKMPVDQMADKIASVFCSACCADRHSHLCRMDAARCKSGTGDGACNGSTCHILPMCGRSGDTALHNDGNQHRSAQWNFHQDGCCFSDGTEY